MSPFQRNESRNKTAISNDHHPNLISTPARLKLHTTTTTTNTNHVPRTTTNYLRQAPQIFVPIPREIQKRHLIPLTVPSANQTPKITPAANSRSSSSFVLLMHHYLLLLGWQPSTCDVPLQPAAGPHVLRYDQARQGDTASRLRCLTHTR